MSRWFPDSLEIALAPDQVVVERRAFALTIRDAEPRILQRKILETGTAPGARVWDGALQVLAASLATEFETGQERHGPVTVILANSFVRYVLVPQSNLLSAEMEYAVLHHCFNEVYGAAAERWELRHSAASGTAFQPASGVDPALLDALRTLFSADRLRLRSIQPRLMAVCNRYRAVLGSGPAWLLLVEPGNLCLGLIAGGGLVRLRSLRSGGNWAAELPRLLEREACLAELDEVPGDVFLWHRDRAIPERLATGGARLHLLQESPSSEIASSNEDQAVVGS